MPRRAIAAALVLAAAAGAQALPPEGQPPLSVPDLVREIHEGSPAARASAAVMLVTSVRAEAVTAARDLLAKGEAADAAIVADAIAEHPAAIFASALVAASRRAGVADNAAAAIDRIGRSTPAELARLAREGLALAALEERAAWIAALGAARTEEAIPDLVACLPGRDAEPAMAALRRLTALPFTEIRDWNFWREQHPHDSLEEILRDAARRTREENQSLRAALERETARANELEKSALKDRLRAVREKKDSAAERALLEREFGNVQPGLRAWAVEEARQSLQPIDLLPTLLRLLESDPALAVRLAAARAAGGIGRERAAEALRRCLSDPAPSMRAAAVDALAAAIGPAAAPDIKAMLAPDQPRAVREAALAALKALKPVGFAAEANGLLAREWTRPAAESVAAGLIELLGALGDASSVEVLVAVLGGSTDKTLRFRVVKSLGEIGSPGAAEALVAVLDRPDAGQEKDVVAEAIRALASVGGEAARKRLERALGEFRDGEGANPRARENAARGLARVGTADSIAPLMVCAQGDPDPAVRKEAWEAAFALANGSAQRLDAMESLLALVGAADAEAPRRIAIRTEIVKPGNFPDAADRAMAHLRPLGFDQILTHDWTGALRSLTEAAALAPGDLELAIRCVTCRVRMADMTGAIAAGEPLLPRAPAGTPEGIELRRALIEARATARDAWRTLLLIPEDAIIPRLPFADRAWFLAEKLRLSQVSSRQIEEITNTLEQWAGLAEPARETAIESAKFAPPAPLVAILLNALSGEDPGAREGASRISQGVAGIVVPAEDGEARTKALEDLKTWPARLTP